MDLKQNIKDNLDMDTKPYPKYYFKYNCIIKCVSYNEIITVDANDDTVDVNITNLSESYFIKEAYKLTNEDHFNRELSKAFKRFDNLINN